MMLEREAVGLVCVLERGPGAVPRIRRSGDGLGLPVAGDPQNPLEPDVEVAGEAALLEDPAEGAIGELLGLLLGVGDHRDIGIRDRHRDRLELAAACLEAGAANRTLGMELACRNPGCDLGFIAALPK